MEWVETTAKTVEEAKDAALDQLGIAADDAEFEVLDEPRPGLFGRTRGEGRVRARIKPTQVRPKQERRRRSGKDAGKSKSAEPTATGSGSNESTSSESEATDADANAESGAPSASSSNGRSRTADAPKRAAQGTPRSNKPSQEKTMSNDEREPSPVSPQEVGDAAVAFMDGLTAAFGATATSELAVDDIELDVTVTGDDLGLLVGPGGRTLNAIQDLVRVSAQRRLGDHETRLRVDVAGYRARRSEALQRFAADVAASVRESGAARALEPMTSADRKVVHDALNDEEGVSSRSEGDDPNRRIIVDPA